VTVPQQASYFVLNLPHHWILLGVDTGEDLSVNDIDEQQAAFFESLLQNYDGGIILVTHCPYWILPPKGGFRFQILLNRIRAVSPTFLWLAGDIHNYSRYKEDTTNSQFLVVGGGGAFLHPNPKNWATTAMPEHFPTSPTDNVVVPKLLTQRRQMAYPSSEDSSSLASLWNLFFKTDLNALGISIGVILSLASIPHASTSLVCPTILFLFLYNFCSAETGGVGHKLLFSFVHWCLHMLTSLFIGVFIQGHDDILVASLAEPTCAPPTMASISSSSVIFRYFGIFDSTMAPGIPCFFLSIFRRLSVWVIQITPFNLSLNWMTRIDDILLVVIALALRTLASRFVIALYFHLSYKLSGWHWNEAFSAMAIVPDISWIEIKFPSDRLIQIFPKRKGRGKPEELIEPHFEVRARSSKGHPGHQVRT
jgi:hypothetical protein